MNVGQLAIRGTLGPLFIGHGTQKLFGWFGGNGIEATGGFFESKLGLRPGKRQAAGAGVAEALGGALITAGAFTPLGATMISGAMVTAIRKVHAPNGPWATDSGYEYNAVILAAMVALTDAGPGTPSFDHARFPKFKGKALAVGQLAAAVAGSYLITEILNEDAPPEEPADEPTASETPATNGHQVPAGATA